VLVCGLRRSDRAGGDEEGGGSRVRRGVGGEAESVRGASTALRRRAATSSLICTRASPRPLRAARAAHLRWALSRLASCRLSATAPPPPPPPPPPSSSCTSPRIASARCRAASAAAALAGVGGAAPGPSPAASRFARELRGGERGGALVGAATGGFAMGMGADQ
jgi:hypothetical protein